MKKAHYIDNALFTKSVVSWINSREIQTMKIINVKLQQMKRDKKQEALRDFGFDMIGTLEKRSEEMRRRALKKMPPYVAECFMKLVDRIGSRPNFMGYTYLEDMKGDALLLCTKYAHNFNPERSNNAFAYFSQIIFNGFKQYLNKEKKYTTYKFELTKGEMTNSERINYNNIVGSNRDADGLYVDRFED